ncbi:MAG: transporter [Burkholderiaceae bacterium]|nr:transporter [Burkholderiaceae bacterium]
MTKPRPIANTALWWPLRHPIFRKIWIASLFSNVGTWMHEVGAGWLMTSLAPDPLMVALVQAATTFPVFLLALPAGALADILDRRTYLIATQIWMGLAAGFLGLFTLTGAANATILLVFTFALGIGSGMMMPAWGAIIPELVPREEIQGAVSLNSVGVNVSRAVGPALAGLIIAATGPGVVFVLNAISFGAVIVALYGWHRKTTDGELPAERLVGALRAGMRYARNAPELRTILVRVGAFVIFASASWALIPLLVRHGLGGGADTYGLFLAALGTGAIAGAFVLPHLRLRISRDKLLRGSTALFAGAMLVLAHSGSIAAGIAAMFFSGMAWISVISSSMAAAQVALPAWVRARGLAFFWVVFMGGMAVGSAIWGQVASWIGIPMSLTLAAIGAMVGMAATWEFRIGQLEVLDLTPTVHWTTPHFRDESEMDRGPVMVMIEYIIEPDKLKEFTHALHQVRRLRRRDGAFMWEMFTDSEEPGKVVECFMIESWLEHLRQHEREIASDKHIYKKARAFHIGERPPKVTHYIGGHLREQPLFW